ncbi:Kelch motif family protein [Reticulomyxa filosa]|uniref:Kelch motif family protein n=1 Tax=Reticulomyxa filosa TaxID=46433 RepID=X6N6W9_RETFI|nr:Kelch motif family protein [Reticulomyxa filosa]|eukprot:ETO22015.1 Kelch motif family protein [Reticulomyxa filosa]
MYDCCFVVDTNQLESDIKDLGKRLDDVNKRLKSDGTKEKDEEDKEDSSQDLFTNIMGDFYKNAYPKYTSLEKAFKKAMEIFFLCMICLDSFVWRGRNKKRNIWGWCCERKYLGEKDADNKDYLNQLNAFSTSVKQTTEALEWKEEQERKQREKIEKEQNKKKADAVSPLEKKKAQQEREKAIANRGKGEAPNASKNAKENTAINTVKIATETQPKEETKEERKARRKEEKKEQKKSALEKYKVLEKKPEIKNLPAATQQAIETRLTTRGKSYTKQLDQLVSMSSIHNRRATRVSGAMDADPSNQKKGQPGTLKRDASNLNVAGPRGLESQKSISFLTSPTTRVRGGSTSQDETKFTKMVLDAIDEVEIDPDDDAE